MGPRQHFKERTGILPGEHFVCSWSGGKDSCLALERTFQAGGVADGLLTMVVEGGTRTRNHGLAVEIVRAQARSLGIPLHLVESSWTEYEKKMVQALHRFRRDGASIAVFGDIDIESHRQWEIKVSEAAGLRAHLPLWHSDRAELLGECLVDGFEARIVAVKVGVLDPSFLGRKLDSQLIEDFSRLGIDPNGERGEYHTVVTSCRSFSQALSLVTGDVELRAGYWFLDFGFETPFIEGTGRRLKGPCEFLKLGEDYYLDEHGRIVFTAFYHRNRGSCCKRGCRHCPYGYRESLRSFVN